MDLNLRMTPSPSTVFQEVEGEAVLLHLDRSEYFGLDEIGTRVWQLLQEHGTLGKVVDQMLLEFDVEQARLEADLERLLLDLAGHGLVTLTAGADSG